MNRPEPFVVLMKYRGEKYIIFWECNDWSVLKVRPEAGGVIEDVLVCAGVSLNLMLINQTASQRLLVHLSPVNPLFHRT